MESDCEYNTHAFTDEYLPSYSGESEPNPTKITLIFTTDTATAVNVYFICLPLCERHHNILVFRRHALIPSDRYYR